MCTFSFQWFIDQSQRQNANVFTLLFNMSDFKFALVVNSNNNNNTANTTAFMCYRQTRRTHRLHGYVTMVFSQGMMIMWAVEEEEVAEHLSSR